MNGPALRLLLWPMAAALLTTAATAQDPAPGAGQLAELSLEQLMEVPVEVASRQSQSLAKTAASVFVLNEPEIRASGLRSVGELLRLVPGLLIAQDVPGAYGFSSRLGEYEFAGMLVLIDGQRLYTTLLRREYFQAIDLPVDVIERIEVVKGPGGSRWGDKASQGVINIVTKKAKDAQGLRVVGGGGTEERLFGTARYGGKVGEDVDYYLFAKSNQRDGGYPNTSGDRWKNNAVGGRIDARVAPNVTLTLDGLYHESYISDSFVLPPGDPEFVSQNLIKGGHLKSRTRFDHDDANWTEWRMGVDAYDQDIIDFEAQAFSDQLIFREQLFDTLLMHSHRLAPGHQVTVGAVVRQLKVHRLAIASNAERNYGESRGDLFASWDWDLCDTVRVTLGGNIGYQDGPNGSGVDTQPDLRLAWAPSADFTVWTALSANRQPDQKIPDSGLLVHKASSHLLAYELGLRTRFAETLLVQADTFLYRVSNQLSDEPTDPQSGATLYVTDGRTDAFGGELSLAWNPLPNVRISPFVANTTANSRNQANYFSIQDQVPSLRGGATAAWDAAPGLQFSSNVLYTESHAGVPSWWRVDLRASWCASASTTVDLVGQNLTDPQHVEYWYSEQSQRGVYLMVAMQL